MWEMAQNTILLFFRGRLFTDPAKVYRQLAIGAGVTALVMLAIAKVGAPLWIAALVAGLVGGALQPYLFKDLRYR